MTDLSDAEILDQLDIELGDSKPATGDLREERIIYGFEEIRRFVEEHGGIPVNKAENDIFQRLYSVRLDRLRRDVECRNLLAPYDSMKLLEGNYEENEPNAATDEELLQTLGVSGSNGDLTDLRHVRSSAEKKAAEEIAQREKCPDFEKFRPIFEQVQRELDTGLRKTRPINKTQPFEKMEEIQTGRLFILRGQKALVADMGEIFRQDYGDVDARIRVIFDNGTQVPMLMRSLQRALTKDEASRRITDPTAGPLFGSSAGEGDEESGTIYVLRSKSDHPDVAKNREFLHKIGVTGGDVNKRIANASKDSSFLLAEVEIIATYKLVNINRKNLEKLLHRIFEPARLDIEIMDRFGNPVTPREWFLVPFPAIDDAVEKIKAGTISRYRYDREKACFVERS